MWRFFSPTSLLKICKTLTLFSKFGIINHILLLSSSIYIFIYHYIGKRRKEPSLFCYTQISSLNLEISLRAYALITYWYAFSFKWRRNQPLIIKEKVVRPPYNNAQPIACTLITRREGDKIWSYLVQRTSSGHQQGPALNQQQPQQLILNILKRGEPGP